MSTESTQELLPYPYASLAYGSKKRAPARQVRRKRDPFVPIWSFLTLLVVVALVGVLSGCAQPGYVRAEALQGPLKRLVDRHDAYVKADKSYADEDRKATDLRDGELLLRVVDSAVEAGAK